MTTRGVKVAKEVYRGYMPIDLPQHKPHKNTYKPWLRIKGKPVYNLYPKPEIEPYSEEPEYPPINDATEWGVRRQIRLDWYDTIKSLPTIEEKFYEINKHCSHRLAHIKNWLPNALSLPMMQYLTRTHVVNSLPPSYTKSSVSQIDDGNQDSSHAESSNQLSELERIVKNIVLDQIALDKYESINKIGYYYVAQPHNEADRKSHIANNMVQNIMNQVKKAVSLEANQQLIDYQTDKSPAIRSWWFHSGVPPPNKKKYYKSRTDDDGNISQMIQVDAFSAMNMRSDNFIEPIVEQSDPMVTDTSLVPKLAYKLNTFGAKYKFRWPVALPGFWFEETPGHDCPHTCFLTTDCLRVRNNFVRNYAKPLDEPEECLNGQAVVTAFSWLNSLSMYHGYTPYHEISYPFTCQVITTDGQNWMFNVFQMNCHTFHRDLGGPMKNNICWSSGLMKLYENYENETFGETNDEVIRLLVRFLTQKTSPQYTQQLNLRPYLGEDKRTDAEKQEQSKRLRSTLEGKKNNWLSFDWKVPLYEHIFFRHPLTRGQITSMKPKWHIPIPKTPKIFE